MMFWESNNLEISVFESRVVRLRTGKIVLNTFKNIHQQSNIFESSKEGAGGTGARDVRDLIRSGWWARDPVWHVPTASFWPQTPSWPQCLWPSLNKGKGRLVLPSVKSNLGWVHFEAGPAGGKDSSLVLPGRVPFLLSNFSVFGFLQEKVLAASLTNIPISFTKGHSIAVPPREKQLSTLSCSLLLSTDGLKSVLEFHSDVCCFRQHKGTRLCFRKWGATLVLSTRFCDWFRSCQILLHQRQVEGGWEALCAQFLPRAAQSYGWASTISSYISLWCFKKPMLTLSPHSPSPCPSGLEVWELTELGWYWRQ